MYPSRGPAGRRVLLLRALVPAVQAVHPDPQAGRLAGRQRGRRTGAGVVGREVVKLVYIVTEG